MKDLAEIEEKRHVCACATGARHTVQYARPDADANHNREIA
jgi:hypothetical protein